MARTSLGAAATAGRPLGRPRPAGVDRPMVGALAFHIVSQLALPPPGGVVATIAHNFFSSRYLANYHLGDGGLAGNLVYTISNVVVALVVSCVVGVTLGFTSARVDLFRAVVDPIMLTAGTIPDPGDRAVLLVWFGVSRSAQVALLILYDITIIYLFAQRAAANLDPTYVAAEPHARRQADGGSSSTSTSWARCRKSSAASASRWRAPGVSRRFPSCSARPRASAGSFRRWRRTWIRK